MEKTVLDWLHIRGPSDLTRIRKFVEKHSPNGYERRKDPDGNAVFRMGFQGDDGGEVKWTSAIWSQLWELDDEIESTLRKKLGFG